MFCWLTSLVGRLHWSIGAKVDAAEATTGDTFLISIFQPVGELVALSAACDG